MPRVARTEVAGGIHHVWQRGNNRQLIRRAQPGACTHLRRADGPLRDVDPDCSPWRMRPRLQEVFGSAAAGVTESTVCRG